MNGLTSTVHSFSVRFQQDLTTVFRPNICRIHARCLQSFLYDKHLKFGLNCAGNLQTFHIHHYFKWLQISLCIWLFQFLKSWRGLNLRGVDMQEPPFLLMLGYDSDMLLKYLFPVAYFSWTIPNHFLPILPSCFKAQLFNFSGSTRIQQLSYFGGFGFQTRVLLHVCFLFFFNSVIWQLLHSLTVKQLQAIALKWISAWLRVHYYVDVISALISTITAMGP